MSTENVKNEEDLIEQVFKPKFLKNIQKQI